MSIRSETISCKSPSRPTAFFNSELSSFAASEPGWSFIASSWSRRIRPRAHDWFVRRYPVSQLITIEGMSGVEGINCLSPITDTSERNAYPTHPNENATGVR
jgi:hypothetical protein